MSHVCEDTRAGLRSVCRATDPVSRGAPRTPKQGAPRQASKLSSLLARRFSTRATPHCHTLTEPSRATKSTPNSMSLHGAALAREPERASRRSIAPRGCALRHGVEEVINDDLARLDLKAADVRHDARGGLVECPSRCLRDGRDARERSVSRTLRFTSAALGVSMRARALRCLVPEPTQRQRLTLGAGERARKLAAGFGHLNDLLVHAAGAHVHRLGGAD
jgi:hypothetical protein